MQKNATLTADDEQFQRRSLLRRHLDGDEQAFAELVSRYRKQVYSYLVRTGVPDGERDDLFQDIFVKVHCHAHQYNPAYPVEPWLFTIVANTVRSYFRKRRLQWVLRDESGELLDRRSSDSEEQANAKETLEWVEAVIRELPFPNREVFLLCSFTDLAQREVAEVLSLPVGTVKTYLSRARQEIARTLAKKQMTIRREVR